MYWKNYVPWIRQFNDFWTGFRSRGHLRFERRETEFIRNDRNSAVYYSLLALLGFITIVTLSSSILLLFQRDLIYAIRDVLLFTSPIVIQYYSLLQLLIKIKSGFCQLSNTHTHTHSLSLSHYVCINIQVCMYVNIQAVYGPKYVQYISIDINIHVY